MSFSRFLKVIHDFPDYTVDIYGRVFNHSGKELKQWVTRDGYCMVRLCRNGYEKSCSVHRLVADAFFDGDHDGYEVNHIDGNKQNNFVGNLEWVTRSENLQHSYKANLRKSPLTKELRMKGTKVFAEQNKRPVRVLETGEIFASIKDCAQALGCASSAISCCCRGYAKQHHGYHFAFADQED